MRFLLSILVVMFSFAAFAAEELKPDAKPAEVKAKEEKEPKVTVINGQKFFSLREARHFSGIKKPMPLTGRPETRKPTIMTHEHIPTVKSPAENATETPAEIMKTTPVTPAFKAPAAQDIHLPQDVGAKASNIASPIQNRPAPVNSPVLDIFAPEEKNQ